MLHNGQRVGALLDEAEEVARGMETMQTTLVSILTDLKEGRLTVDEVELTRNPQTGEVVSVGVNRIAEAVEEPDV